LKEVADIWQPLFFMTIRTTIRQLPLFPVKPDLISIHIPKTAGSTLTELLRQNYGRHFKHLYTPEDWTQFEKSKPYRTSKPGIKAIHGHLHHINPVWKTLYPNAKWITWLRDPADRLISAYFHWLRPINHHDPHHIKFAEKMPSLLEFAEDPEFFPTTRVYEPLLANHTPNDFFFIGRFEAFEADTRQLGKLLGWQRLLPLWINVNPSKSEINSKDRNRLAEMLIDEYKIYREFYPDR
jgi:hypothetical protein